MLVRVAPAVERPGIHLGVWRDAGDQLRVWGTTRLAPTDCMVLEVAGPGLLVVKHHRGDGGKYVNVAVLEGDRIKVIDDRATALPDCPSSSRRCSDSTRQAAGTHIRTYWWNWPSRCARTGAAGCS